MNSINNVDVSLPMLSKRKRFRPRWIVLVSVQILILLHIIMWLLGKHYGWFGGKTLTPIEPSEGMEFVKYGVVNAGAIFFALALLSTLVFGRWFCGWGCHIVLLQDFCFWMLRKIHIRPKPFRARLLLWFPLGLATYMYLWPLFYRFALAPIFRPELRWPGITTHFFTEDYWGTFSSPIIAVPFLLVCGFATVYVLGAKGFCTYGCPYGGFFKSVDSISPMRVRVNDNCQQCGKCTAACTSNVRVHEEVHLYKMVIDNGCMKTSDCISVCPNDALHIGFGPIAAGKREQPRKYDLSISEEIWVAVLFLIGFFAFRGMYASIPMLMAVGMSLVNTWLIWKSVRVLQTPNSSFHKHRLRFHGKMKPAGLVFLAVSFLALIFTVQSAAVGSFRFLGDRAKSKEKFDDALYYYKLSGPMTDGGVGIASNPNVDMTMSKIYELQGNYDESERLLRRIDSRVGMDERSTMLLGQIMQYHRQFVTVESFYEERLAIEPTWGLVWEDYVGWLKREGVVESAIVNSKKSVELNPEAERLKIQLVMLETEFGDVEHAIYVARQLVEQSPDSPTPWMLLSRALHQAGRISESREAHMKAASLQSAK